MGRKLLMIGVLCFLVVSFLYGENWTSFMKDERNSGLVGETLEQNSMYFKWEKNIGGKVLGSPIIVDGRVYVGNSEGTFYCLDLSSGEVIWRYQILGSDIGADRTKKVPKNIYSTPAYGDGKVYFSSYNGLLYCLNAYSGEKLWTYQIGYNTIASPLYVNGVVLCGSGSKKGVFGLQGTTGRKLFFLESNAVVTSAPAYYDNKVYFLDTESTLYCYNFTTHEKLWEYPVPTGFSFVNSVSVDPQKGVFFYPSYGYRLVDVNENDFYGLDFNGNTIWQIDPANIGATKARTKPQKMSFKGMLSLLHRFYPPNPQNPSMYDPNFLNLSPEQEKAFTERMKAQVAKNIRRKLKSKFSRFRAKGGALQKAMQKVSNPQAFPRQYNSNIVIDNNMAYFIMAKQGSLNPTGPSYYTNYYYLVGVDLVAKSVVFQQELGRIGEKDPALPDSFFSSVAPDAYDLVRFVPSPVVVGNRVFAVTPSGRVRMYDKTNGNLLWEDANFSLIYGTPAYSDGRIVVVDKYGKIGCYGVNQQDQPMVKIIEPSKQVVVDGSDDNYRVKVKWIFSGVDINSSYYLHFYYDTDRSGYDGKPTDGLMFRRLKAANEGYWNVSTLERDKFYYLYPVLSDAPLGSDPIKDATHVYYGEYAQFPVLITQNATSPHITLLNPVGEVYLDPNEQSSYTIHWVDSDEDSNASISLYYAPDPSMAKAKLIKSGISEDDENDYYVFNTMIAATDDDVVAAGGKVYFWARIDDGDGAAVFAVSPGYLKLSLTGLKQPHLKITHYPLSDQYNVDNTTTYPVIAYLSGPRSLDQAKVYLYYKLEGESSYQSLAMSTDDYYKYSASIPHYEEGVVHYYITADDGVEKARAPETGDYSFKVEKTYSGYVTSFYSWQATMEAVAGDIKADFIWGMSGGSGVTSDYDEGVDMKAELPSGTGLAVYTELQDTTSNGNVIVSKDITLDKKLDNDVWVIPLYIKAKGLKGKKITLSWNVTDVKNKYVDYFVMLLDEKENLSIDMKAEDSYEISVDSDDFTYQLKLSTGLAYFEREGQAGWNLVSFPIKPLDDKLNPLSIGKYFTGILNGNRNYTVYYYDPEIKAFVGYNPYYGGRLNYFELGKGYWIYLPEDKTLTFKGYTASKFPELSKNNRFEITLRGGDWNMISSPRLKPFPWSEVTISYQGEELNLLDAIEEEIIKPYAFWFDNGGFRLQFLRTFNGSSYTVTDERILPGYGYFLRVEKDCKLIFPLPAATTYAPPPKKKSGSISGKIQKKSIFVEVDNWSCKLSLKVGGYEDPDNYLGISPLGQNEADEMDVMEPPVMAPGVSLYFPHEDYFKEAGNYTVDFREPVDENGNIVWEIVVQKTSDIKDTKGELSWKLEDFPASYKLFLVDEDTGAEYDMKSQKEITFNFSGDSNQKKFKVLYYKYVRPNK